MQLSKRTAQISPVFLFVLVAGTAMLVNDSTCAWGQLGDLDCDLDDCSCGTCDAASELNLWNPSITHPMIIKTKMLVFANDNGSALAVSNTVRNAQIDQLNTDFQDYGIHFDVDPVQVNDTCYRYLCDEDYLNYCNSSQLRYDDATPVQELCCNSYHPQTGCDLEDYQEVQMKETYAEEGKLNIFITSTTTDWGVYPWSSRATTKTGGVMVMPYVVGGETCGTGGDHCTELTHEAGHALGLRHTHDVPVSGPDQCPEPATCTGGVDCTECDHLGDMCCDTPSSEFEDDLTNYMSYGGATEHFTAQQTQRMHCWICNELPEWIDSPDCNLNGKPDVCEITRGDKTDCDQDGIPDEDCDAGGACCLTSYECVKTPTSDCCDALGGVHWYGLGTKCRDIDCFTGPMGPQGP